MDLLDEIRELRVPVFILGGRHGQTATAVLAEELFRAISAPHKRLIWFEQSAHPPDFEEPEKFQQELIAIGDEFCGGAPESQRTLAVARRRRPVPAQEVLA